MGGGSKYTLSIKKPKTGAFVGGEIGFGSAYAGAWGPRYGWLGYNNGYLAVPINVFGGYQWYFYDKPYFNLGVRVRGHLGYTNYNADLSYYWYDYNNVTLTSNAFALGAEAAFMWDFFDYKEHTVGVHFSPLGFEVGIFAGSAKAGGISAFDLGTHAKFAYIVSLGFHYYYALQHQVFVGWKYRSYANTVSGNDKFYSVAPHLFTIGYSYKF